MGTYTGSDKRLQYLFQNGGGGGASALSDLSDVELTNLANNQIIKYNSTTQKWENANESGGGSANIWTGTKAEYEAQASQIADDTVVLITDDEEQTQAMQVYSTDEQVIGTWLGETLYCKVFDNALASGAQVTANTWYDTGIQVSGIKAVIGATLIGKPSASVVGSAFIVSATITNGKINFNSPRAFTYSLGCQIILQYTKTV